MKYEESELAAMELSTLELDFAERVMVPALADKGIPMTGYLIQRLIIEVRVLRATLTKVSN